MYYVLPDCQRFTVGNINGMKRGYSDLILSFLSHVVPQELLLAVRTVIREAQDDVRDVRSRSGSTFLHLHYSWDIKN